MSSSNTSDPRLLLPDWLRDGEVPLPEAPHVAESAQNEIVSEAVVAVAEIVPAEAVVVPVAPYSDRLSLDTRLDPGQLVSPQDLPTWLGGLERTDTVQLVTTATSGAVTHVVAPATPAVEESEPYVGVDAPEPGVIDVEVNGWYVIAAGLGLLILLAAALRLYFS